MTNDLIKFDFQTIELSEIAKLLPPRSKYAPLAQQIIERIHTTGRGKTFIFAPPKGSKMEERDIIGLCHGVSVYLAKERLNWRIKYSQQNNCFIVAPLNLKMVTKKTMPLVDRKEIEQKLNFLLSCVQKTFHVTLNELKVKNGSDEINDIKRALYYVGKKKLRLRLVDMRTVLNQHSGSASTFCAEALIKPSAQEKVRQLFDAINRNAKLKLVEGPLKKGA